MRLILISFFLLLMQPIFSQEYQQYAELINEAEISAIHDSFSTALKYYSQAFSSYKNIFCKDYYNAAVCAEKINNHKLAIKYLVEIYRKGYSLNSLQSRDIFKELIKTKEFKKNINGNRFATALAKYNIKLRNILDSMVEKDQMYRRLNPRNYINDVYADTIKKIDSLNAYLLVSIIKQYGFPDEFSIGVDSQDMMKYNWEVLLIHQQHGSLTRVVNFSDDILEAVVNGKVLSHRGVCFYVSAAGIDTLFGSGCFFKVTDSTGNYKFAYFREFKPGPEALYNKNRATYNLENLEDYRQKMLYWLKNKNRDFIFDFYMGENVIDLDEGMTPYIKGLTYIK